MGLGQQALGRDAGYELPVRVWTDSSAAKSFVNRRGLGKMRHLEIRDLSIQKEVADGKLEVVKVGGDKNPADLMTKILKTKEIEDRLNMMNIAVRYVRGRSRTQSIFAVSRRGRARPNWEQDTVLQALENQRKQLEDRIKDYVLDVRRSGLQGQEEDGRRAKK